MDEFDKFVVSHYIDSFIGSNEIVPFDCSTNEIDVPYNFIIQCNH
jgi:hypothetical protein